MTTFTIYFPKWVGKIGRGIGTIVCVIMALPFAIPFVVPRWLDNHKIEFKERP